MKSQVLGLTLGLILGFVVLNPVITYAQQQLRASDENAICWDQVSPSLEDARALKLEVTFDGGTTRNDLSLVCNGGASPYECGFQIPIANQTVGNHNVSWRLGNVEADNTISWNNPTSFSYTIVAEKGNPAQPSNPRAIKKKLVILILTLVAGSGATWKLVS